MNLVELNNAHSYSLFAIIPNNGKSAKSDSPVKSRRNSQRFVFPSFIPANDLTLFSLIALNRRAISHEWNAQEQSFMRSGTHEKDFPLREKTRTALVIVTNETKPGFFRDSRALSLPSSFAS